MDTKKKVLIIEDEAPLSKILAETLTEVGLEVDVAVHGEEGWHKTRENRPDLILLDIIMPRLDGFVFLKRLRANKKLADIPVIILSNLGQESDIAEARELGALDYLVKSNHTIEAIVQRVQQVLHAS
ncbi:MAG: two-component response regulator [uncultured bacterium]|nr:MAG: two-component response regulator [uncultured bacterium]HBY73792.1 response regulator [Candidatus Kerfeldbacteria bacterium]